MDLGQITSVWINHNSELSCMQYFDVYHTPSRICLPGGVVIDDHLHSWSLLTFSHKSLISNFSYFHIRLFHSMHFLFIIKISFMLFSCHEIYDISEVFFPLCFETKMHTEISWERVALYSIKEVFQHRRRNNKTIALSCEAFSYFFISKKKRQTSCEMLNS